MADPTYIETYRNLRRHKGQKASPPLPLQDDGGDDKLPPMNDRVSKLEGQQEGLKQSQNILIMAVGAVSAILIALGIYTVARLDSLSAQVGDLPDQINARLVTLNNTFAQELAAVRSGSQQPVVVVVPGQSNEPLSYVPPSSRPSPAPK